MRNVSYWVVELKGKYIYVAWRGVSWLQINLQAFDNSRHIVVSLTIVYV